MPVEGAALVTEMGCSYLRSAWSPRATAIGLAPSALSMPAVRDCEGDAVPEEGLAAVSIDPFTGLRTAETLRGLVAGSPCFTR